MTDVRCGTCRYFDSNDFAWLDEDDDEGETGRCDWPSDRLPLSLRLANRERETTRANRTGCPCWESIPPPEWHCGGCKSIVVRNEHRPTEACMRCGKTDDWTAGPPPSPQPPTPTEADDVLF